MLLVKCSVFNWSSRVRYAPILDVRVIKRYAMNPMIRIGMDVVVASGAGPIDARLLKLVCSAEIVLSSRIVARSWSAMKSAVRVAPPVEKTDKTVLVRTEASRMLFGECPVCFDEYGRVEDSEVYADVVDAE